MTVRRDESGSIILAGVCAVEDAEPLLQLLQATPDVAVDWTACSQLHTAVLQVILAAGLTPVGRCGDPWVATWVLPNAL